MEKYGVEVTKKKKPGEKTAEDSCPHTSMKTEGKGKQKVYFCEQCKKYIEKK